MDILFAHLAWMYFLRIILWNWHFSYGLWGTWYHFFWLRNSSIIWVIRMKISFIYRNLSFSYVEEEGVWKQEKWVFSNRVYFIVYWQKTIYLDFHERESRHIYAHRPCTFYAQNVHIFYYGILDRIINVKVTTQALFFSFFLHKTSFRIQNKEGMRLQW